MSWFSLGPTCRARRASGLKLENCSPYHSTVRLSLSVPALPNLLAVYNKLLSCIQKKQALHSIWVCCLELFMTYFGLSRQGHKYTVNLPDSKSNHFGPTRLTTCGNRDPLSFQAAQLLGEPGALWVGWVGTDAPAALLGHFLSLHSPSNTQSLSLSCLALGDIHQLLHPCIILFNITEFSLYHCIFQILSLLMWPLRMSVSNMATHVASMSSAQ